MVHRGSRRTRTLQQLIELGRTCTNTVNWADVRGPETAHALLVCEARLTSSTILELLDFLRDVPFKSVCRCP